MLFPASFIELKFTESGEQTDSPGSSEVNGAYFGLQLRSLREVAYDAESTGGSLGLIKLNHNPLSDIKEGESNEQAKVRIVNALNVIARYSWVKGVVCLICTAVCFVEKYIFY